MSTLFGYALASVSLSLCVCVGGWVARCRSLYPIPPLSCWALAGVHLPRGLSTPRTKCVSRGAVCCSSPIATVRAVVGKEEQANGQPARRREGDRVRGYEPRTRQRGQVDVSNLSLSCCSLLLCRDCYLGLSRAPSLLRSRGGGTRAQASDPVYQGFASPIDRSGSSSLGAGRHALAAREASQHVCA